MLGDFTERYLSILSSKVGAVLLTFAITPVLVRILGSAKYGDYAFLLSFLGIAMILINGGIFDGVRKYMAEDRTEAFPDWQSQVFGFYLRVAGGMAVVGAGFLVLSAVSGMATVVLGDTIVRYFVPLVGIILTRQLFASVRSALMGLGLEYYGEPLIVLRRGVFALVGLPLAYVGFNIDGILLGHVVASLAMGAIGLAVLRRRIDLTAVLRRVPAGFPWHELLAFNALSVVLIFLITSLYHVDILLLRAMRGSQETGYYKAALLTAEFLWFVPWTLQTMLLHSSSGLWAEGGRERITALASRIFRLTLVFSLLLLVGIAALADSFVPLYFGPEFSVAVVPLLLLLPGVLGFAVARPVLAIEQGRGNLRFPIVASGTAAGINLGLNLLLIPRFGMAGAAIATSAGYGSMILFHVIAARLLGFDPLADARLLRILATVSLAGPVIYAIASVIKSDLLSLLLVPPIGFAVYCALAVKLRAVAPAEVELFLDRLPPSLADLGAKTLELLQ